MDHKKTKFSMREALEIIQWGRPNHLKGVLEGRPIDQEKAQKLILETLKKCYSYIKMYGNPQNDVQKCIAFLDVLENSIPGNVLVQVLNTGYIYDMSFLERACILHDDVASVIAPKLMKMGAHPLRAEAFSNAIFRSIENNNIKTLKAFYEAGLRIESKKMEQRVMECAAQYNVEALELLTSLYGLDVNCQFEDGGNILHWIARTQDIEQAEKKLKWCNSKQIKDVSDLKGWTSLDIAKRWGSTAMCTLMETFHQSHERPKFPDTHPFLRAANQMLQLNSPESRVLAQYLTTCAQWGLRGHHRIFPTTGFGVGAIAIELGDYELLEAALAEGETVNAFAPEGASLVGYAAMMFQKFPMRRDTYLKMFELLLQGPVDWDMYDNKGTSVRTWVENALLEQRSCYKDNRVIQMLQASKDPELSLTFQKQAHC